MQLDSTYQLKRAIDYGFRQQGLDALSADWTIITGTSPADLAVKDTTARILWQPTISVVPNPRAFYNPAQTLDHNSFRVRGSLHPKTGNACAVVVWDTVVVYEVEVNEPANTITLYARVGGTLTAVGSVSIAIAPSTWYRVAFEKMGAMIYGYYIPTGAADILNLQDDSYLTQFAAVTDTYTSSKLFYGGVAIGGTFGTVADYNAAADLLWEEFVPPVASTQPSGTGFPTPVPSPYLTYKNLRMAVSIYNNLMLGP